MIEPQFRGPASQWILEIYELTWRRSTRSSTYINLMETQGCWPNPCIPPHTKINNFIHQDGNRSCRDSTICSSLLRSLYINIYIGVSINGGTPNSWMVFLSWKIPTNIHGWWLVIFLFQAERSLHDALAVLYQTVQVAGGTRTQCVLTRCLKRHRYPLVICYIAIENDHL